MKSPQGVHGKTGSASKSLLSKAIRRCYHVPVAALSTTHGGGAFPETHWSVLCDLGGNAAERKRSLETFALRYWKPICLYLRQALRVDREASKDLTQGFFSWLVGTPVLERYEPDRGSFRSYLKGVLRNYVRNQRTKERAKKRGGDQVFEQLDFGTLPDPAAVDPERAFDLAWTQELIGRASKRLRGQLLAEGKQEQLAAYEAYELPSPGTKPTYASVAEQLDLTPRAVRHYLSKTRERLRSEIRADLLDTVLSSQQLDDEWQALFCD